MFEKMRERYRTDRFAVLLAIGCAGLSICVACWAAENACEVVFDTTAPSITLVGGASVSVSMWKRWVDPGVVVVDRWDQNPTWTASGGVRQWPGTYRVVYTARDWLGNVTEAVRVVKVTLL